MAIRQRAFAGSLRWLGLLLLVLAVPVPAFADSWALPGAETYQSPNGKVRVTITPRALKSQLAYFRDLAAERKLPGQRARGPHHPVALLERVDESGGWHRLWEGALVNDVAPVRALVSDSGAFVTFDNWHLVGWGDDVVAIYAADGRLVRRFSLEALVRPEHFEGFSRSTSSIWWSGAHRISADGTAVILQVAVPGRQRYVPLEIDLATGTPLTSADAVWAAAQAVLSEPPGAGDPAPRESADAARRRAEDEEAAERLEATAERLEAMADQMEALANEAEVRGREPDRSF